jgi:hypothetical protein
LAVDGVYRTDHHRAISMAREGVIRDSDEVVAIHVRRLEALRRAGIVERVAEGVWRVPSDLPDQGRQYDNRLGDASVTVRSHLSIEQQKRAVGATWLDQQLIGGGKDLGERGFGAEARDALRQRSDFLIEQGLAERRGQRIILARSLLATLRERDVETAAVAIAKETGLAYRPVVDGERVSGVYRRDILLASGRFAMLDGGIGFSLVPWRPVIERQFGHPVTAVVHGSTATWEIGRNRGRSIG